MISGRHVSLGPVQTADSAQLFAWINDPAIVNLHAPFRPVDSETHRRWMETLADDPSKVVFAIREHDTERLVGIVQLVSIHDVHRSAELRVRIGADTDRGKGWGREAVDLCCRFGFSNLGLKRIFLHVFADNARAIAAYEASSFVLEGRMRDAAYIDGAWKDVAVMARLAPSSGESEFTETGFSALLDALLAGGYRFASYGDEGDDRHVLWRHDVDFSMHRAARLAQIEQARGVRATYFVNPRCAFYNLMEPTVAAKLAEIGACGHDIGLHFEGAPREGSWTPDALKEAVGFEKRLLEELIGRPVGSVSWHNPDQSNLLDFTDDQICGAQNVYSPRLRERYVYCSDSNGYWRFQRMQEVIADGHDRLHLLTHPAWWTPAPLSPDARIDRAVLGRARAVRANYDALLDKAGRRKRALPNPD